VRVTDEPAGPTFSVTVVDAITGAPLPKAEVCVVRYEVPMENGRRWSNELEYADTGDDGSALVHTSGPGWFDVRAEADGYAPSGRESFECEAGMQYATVELLRAGEFECHVSNAAGEPVSGVYVFLVEEDGGHLTLIEKNSDGGMRSDTRFSTDTDGRMGSNPCPVGRYLVEVRAGRAEDSRLLASGEAVITAGNRTTVELQTDL